MTFCMICMIAIGLAMDAFAVAISNGVSVKSFGLKESVWQGLYFGVFQLFMPLFGWFLGSRVKDYIVAVDHWIAFVLLVLIGGNMIKDSFVKEGIQQKKNLSTNMLFWQAVATSIDAFAVGIGFAMLDVNIVKAVTTIGVISFGIAFLGGILGKCLGNFLQMKAEFAGGVLLVGIGLKICIQHLFFSA